MKLRCRQLFAVLLAVLVSLGMTVSALQAGGAAAKVASGLEDGTCDGCGDDGSSVCVPACASPLQAVLPAHAAVTGAVEREAPPRDARSVEGRVSPPDPSPPRPALA